jgi:threonine dehydratase
MASSFSLSQLEAAADLVHRTLPPTPQYAWPLISERLGCETWVKHENHTPTGAFKVRGGLVYIDDLKSAQPDVAGVISATRGNHGQSIALAAARAGLRSLIYIPHGNSVEKNAAMRAFGAELVEHGADFDEAKDECMRVAEARGLHPVPSFHPLLVRGVATYALEFFRACPDLDVAYVPIGMGSGVCGMMAARDLLGLKTRIVGVVAENAPAVALSVEANRLVVTNSARTFADGMACRAPHPDALELMWQGLDHVVRVTEDEIADAMRTYYTATHNVAEGAGAAPLAAASKEKAGLSGSRVGVVLSGSNIDTDVFATVLSGATPQV